MTRPATLAALASVAALGLHCTRAEVAAYCSSVGPPCGLTVVYDGGDLDAGTYTITIETPAGVTTCDYLVDAPSPDVQTAGEAEKQDEALAACAENGTCHEPCTGPDKVYLRRSSLTVDSDAEEVGIIIENVETGARSEASFVPAYVEHPEECAACVTASDAMPLPAG